MPAPRDLRRPAPEPVPASPPTPPAPEIAAERDAEAGERRALAGVAIMAGAMLLLPGLDAAGKLLATGAPPYGPPMSPLQIAFARMTVQSALMLPIALFWVGLAALAPPYLGLLILRGLCLAMATALFFAALIFMSIAESIAIFFVEPLILTVLSAAILGEPIGWRRIAAVLVGFAGALIVIRPNFIEVGWPALLPLGTAFCFAFYLLLTKILSERVPAMTAHLWTGLVGCAALGLGLVTASTFAPDLAIGDSASTLGAHWPTPAQWTMIAVLGAIATVGHFLVILAFARAPASRLAPLQYLEIVSATALGWMIFGDFPDSLTWLGVAVIVSSGLFVWSRERTRAKEAGGGA